MGLPQLLVIGAQKGGTSTLHLSLASHDAIDPARDPETGKVVKELNFFGNHWDKGLDWYQNHFHEPNQIGMEATPNYLCDYHAHERMAAVLPDAKLIISLREPVSRAYSQFNHYSQILDETLHWDWSYPGESFEKTSRQNSMGNDGTGTESSPEDST